MQLGTDERFAVTQAAYKVIAAQVGTGNPDNLRGEVDAASLDLYDATRGKVRDLVLNGAKVGEMRVETKSAYYVTDRAAYDAWCRDNGYDDGSEGIDWTRLTNGDRLAARTWLKEHYPQMFVVEHRSPEPSDDWMMHRDEVCFDIESGEEVPGVEYSTQVTKTVVSGCKWDDASMTKTERGKFTPVSVAARGLLPGEFVAALLPGGGE
ncbi:MAG TPA: hypothetical protein DEV22_02745 [Collinsella sp.]|nr:hypothetical protein [Collinsella sp.]